MIRSSIASLAVALPAVLTSGCIETDYMGREYPPTDRVDVYYELEDLPRPNHVMGHLQAEVLPGTDYETVEAELVEEAMARGADALVIEGADMVDADARTPGFRYEPVVYVRTEDGELRHERAPNRPVPRFTQGIRDRILNAQLVRF